VRDSRTPNRSSLIDDESAFALRASADQLVHGERPDAPVPLTTGQEDEVMRQGLTRTVFTLSLAMVILLGVSTHASAATYRIWYYDDDFNTYNPGDVSVGWVKFVPPAWACTLKIYWPDHYSWIGDYANVLEAGNLNQHVTVSLPRPGCPIDGAATDENGGIVVREGNTEIPFELGTHYLDIDGNEDMALNWLDENGSNHACGFGCATPPVGFKYLNAKSFQLVSLGRNFEWQQTMLLLPAMQKVREAAARMRNTITLLSMDVGVPGQIAMRRRSNLGDWEAGVRALEDAALARLGEAARRIAEVDAFAAQQKLTSAYVSADLGSEAINAVSELLRAAESSFPPRVQ